MTRRPKNTTELLRSNITWTAKDETKRTIQYMSVEPKIVAGKIYNCWWCTLPITDQEPLGCPLSEKDGVYHTDGLFCTVNCIKAYLLEHCANDARYQNSLTLLAFMYIELSGELSTPISEPVVIPPSPHWKFLVQYGGSLTPEQYKETIGKIMFTSKGIIKQHPITFLYTEEVVY